MVFSILDDCLLILWCLLPIVMLCLCGKGGKQEHHIKPRVYGESVRSPAPVSTYGGQSPSQITGVTMDDQLKTPPEPKSVSMNKPSKPISPANKKEKSVKKSAEKEPKKQPEKLPEVSIDVPTKETAEEKTSKMESKHTTYSKLTTLQLTQERSKKTIEAKTSQKLTQEESIESDAKKMATTQKTEKSQHVKDANTISKESRMTTNETEDKPF